MEKINLDHFAKNIPIPPEKEYELLLIKCTEQFTRQMRWRAFFFLNPGTNGARKENYSFKSRKNPPYIAKFKEFEDDLLSQIVTSFSRKT